MSKLWIIGDSFSAEFFHPKEGPNSYKNLYSKYKGYTPKFFGQIISERLNIDYQILPEGPNDNSRMLELFIDNMDKMKDGDILSFGWTSTSRLSIVDCINNKWEIVNAGNMTGDFLHGIRVSSLVDFAINRDHILYIKQLIKWMKLIDRSVPNVKVIHWTWTNNTYFPFERIVDDTEGIIDDIHWSEKGHEQFANWFLDVYNKKIENKCYEIWAH